MLSWCDSRLAESPFPREFRMPWKSLPKAVRMRHFEKDFCFSCCKCSLLLKWFVLCAASIRLFSEGMCCFSTNTRHHMRASYFCFSLREWLWSVEVRIPSTICSVQDFNKTHILLHDVCFVSVSSKRWANVSCCPDVIRDFVHDLWSVSVRIHEAMCMDRMYSRALKRALTIYELHLWMTSRHQEHGFIFLHTSWNHSLDLCCVSGQIQGSKRMNHASLPCSVIVHTLFVWSWYEVHHVHGSILQCSFGNCSWHERNLLNLCTSKQWYAASAVSIGGEFTNHLYRQKFAAPDVTTGILKGTFICIHIANLLNIVFMSFLHTDFWEWMRTESVCKQGCSVSVVQKELSFKSMCTFIDSPWHLSRFRTGLHSFEAEWFTFAFRIYSGRNSKRPIEDRPTNTPSIRV